MRCTTTNNFESLIIAPAHHTRHDTALPRPLRCRYAARPRASLLSSPRRSPFRTRTQRSRRENRSSSTASRQDRRWISGHGRTRTWRRCPRRRRRRAAAQVRLHPLQLPSRCRVNSAGASILTCPPPPRPPILLPARSAAHRRAYKSAPLPRAAREAAAPPWQECDFARAILLRPALPALQGGGHRFPTCLLSTFLESTTSAKHPTPNPPL